MSDVVDFPGEYRTQQARERDRWSTVAFCAAVIAGRPQNEQLPFLRAALAKFAEVPDKQPSLDDTQAYAAFAVKMLLDVLTDESGLTALAGTMAAKAAMDRFLDDPHPNPPGAA